MQTSVSCPRGHDIERLVVALKEHPGLDPADRCLALDGIKKALCPCLEVCDRWARELAGYPAHPGR